MEKTFPPTFSKQPQKNLRKEKILAGKIPQRQSFRLRTRKYASTMPSLLLCSTLLFVLMGAALAGTEELEQIIAKYEQDVVEFARKVEDFYSSRCTFALEYCERNNYDECLSTLPNPSCLGMEEFPIDECDGCGALFDNTVSTVRLPKGVADGNGNPTDIQTIESICYSRQLDQWFRDKKATDASHWGSFGVQSPPMFFASRDGSFRIFPGRQSRACDYDPRKRPFYVAASSGPKNVILILDTSGSMAGQRLALLKEAAKQVVSTLTVGDRIAIVRFDSTATSLTDPNGRMFTATETNIQTLLNEIDRFEASGSTNFYDAFNTAFTVMQQTIEQELHVDCNSAILFLTDGEMTEPSNLKESDIINFVTTRLEETAALTGHPVLLFTFSVSEDDEVHAFPKALACSTDFGVWSKIVDARFIVESFESYYTLFSLGLGQSSNEDFVAWVEPYSFATGGILGTTASAPVYDRSTDPPIFVGVVGIDFTMSAINKALGLEAGSQEALDRFILASKAKCPSLNLTICKLESFRHQGAAGSEALCTANCTENDFVKIEPEKCPNISVYPRDVWNNIESKGSDYKKSGCCDEAQSASQCSASLSTHPPVRSTSAKRAANIPIIAGVTAGGITTLFIITAAALLVWRKPHKTPKAATSPSAVEFDCTLIPLPPPRNPDSAPPMHFDNSTTRVTGMADKWYDVDCGAA